MSKTEHVLLGSGDLYLVDFSGEIPEEDETIECPQNLVGGIKGGATLTYNATLYTVVDDMRRFSQTIITGEEAIFKSGLLKWSLGDLARLTLTSRSSTDEANAEIMKIGGKTAPKKTLARFVHTMGDGKKFRLTIVGTPAAGFELALGAEAETILNAEFRAEPHDSEGTLILIMKDTEE